MPYRTKEAMKILMELTMDDATTLWEIVRGVQKELCEGKFLIPFDEVEREEAVSNMKEFLSDIKLDIPAYLKDHLERFMELMVRERAPMNQLEDEYANALDSVVYYDLCKPDDQETSDLKMGDRPDIAKIYEHYGVAEDIENIKNGKYRSIGNHIVRNDELKELTADMAGFGMDKSQRIIIEYDKNYGWAMIKRILMDYGSNR